MYKREPQLAQELQLILQIVLGVYVDYEAGHPKPELLSARIGQFALFDSVIAVFYRLVAGSHLRNPQINEPQPRVVPATKKGRLRVIISDCM